MPRKDWTPEQIDIFRKEVAAGGTTPEIAARLTARLGFKVTKNSVIGRCHRMAVKSSTPGVRIAGTPASEPTRAQDEALLRILRMHAEGYHASAIRARIKYRLTVAEIRSRIAEVRRAECEAEGWSTIGTYRVAA